MSARIERENTPANVATVARAVQRKLFSLVEPCNMYMPGPRHPSLESLDGMKPLRLMRCAFSQDVPWKNLKCCTLCVCDALAMIQCPRVRFFTASKGTRNEVSYVYKTN